MKVVCQKNIEYTEDGYKNNRKNKSIMSESGSFTSTFGLNPIIRHFELIQLNGENFDNIFVLKEEDVDGGIVL